MKYERLTERTEDGGVKYCVSKIYNHYRIVYPNGNEDSLLIDNADRLAIRLAELEDKIEQGTLIELPCKVGDTVYWVWEEYSNGKQKLSIEEWEVEKICIEKNEWAVKGLGEELVEGVREFFWCHSSKFGIWWFLTREEAEKRLKELQE